MSVRYANISQHIKPCQIADIRFTNLNSDAACGFVYLAVYLMHSHGVIRRGGVVRFLM